MRGGKGSREKGHVLILSFLLVALLAALAAAQMMMVQKNIRQSSFYNHLSALRWYGESGIHLALYEMTNRVRGSDGLIGTEFWAPESDVGCDGKAGTKDEGEGDGAPNPGEPGTSPVPIGPFGKGINLLVHTSDTEWPDVKRIVSVATDPFGSAAQEVYAREAHPTVPGVSPIYIQPEFKIDVNGNSFLVSGTDTNPGGKPAPTGSKVDGITTSIGDPAGSNSSTLAAEIPNQFKDQITGAGGFPSITETDKIDFGEVWSWFANAPKRTVPPGTYYLDPTFGNAAKNDYRVTYCKGDIELSGGFIGAGVLIVEGNVLFSGHSEFSGLVIVKGDVRLTGGGYGVHIYGSLLAGKSETDTDPTLTISGNTTVAFSSLALANACKLIPPYFTVLSWKDIRG